MLPTWSRTVRLFGEQVAVQDVLGVAPSIDATYRFTRKLREHSGVLAACLDRVLAGLREAIPGLGENLAIDGSDLPAYANGMRDLPNGKPRFRYADPDASWGHRSAISTRKGGGYYGYKVHAAVCTKTDLPLAWHVASACHSEHEHMPSLLDTVTRRGSTPGTCALDTGYDGSGIYAACESRDLRPIIPLKLTVNVVNGLHKPPSCPHGVWTFAGSDTKRGASKWRCPTGKCTPARCGSRPTGCTPSSPAPPTAGRRSTAPGSLWSASSGDSNTSGHCCHYGSVAYPGWRCTRT